MEIQPVQAKLNAEVKADLAPVVQATANLVDSPRKGVGKILHALVGPWIAQRERTIELLQAQTEKDCSDIKSGTKVYREERLLDSPAPTTPVNAYDAIHTLNHMADARRLQAAVEDAARQISDVPPEEISDEPISQTFFNRWRREAEMIDEDDLRQFWARLLVEETKKPNSISPGTLEVARNLTRSDALLFQKLCRGVVKNALVVDRKDNPIHGTYSDMLTLQDVGLLNSQKSSISIVHDSGHAAEYFRPLRLVIFSKAKELHYSCHLLTRAGREIMQTITVDRTQEDVIAVAKLMTAHEAQTEVFVFKIQECRKADGSIDFKADLQSPVWSSGGMR